MLELQRNLIFGQYVDTGSPIHRLDPRLKIAGLVLLVAASFLVDTLVGFALLVPLLALIQRTSRLPFGYVLRGSRYFLVFLALLLTVEVLLFPAGAGAALFRWRFLSLTVAGVQAAALVGAKVLLLYYATTMLLLCTALVDLTDGLEGIVGPLQRIGIPAQELVLVGVIALKFVPIFTAEAERLSRAQTARGVPFDQGGPLVRARRIARLLVPIFISGFRRADVLTEAMDARSYRGGRHRTKLRQLHATRGDWIMVLVMLGWVVAAWRLPSLAGL